MHASGGESPPENDTSGDPCTYVLYREKGFDQIERTKGEYDMILFLGLSLLGRETHSLKRTFEKLTVGRFPAASSVAS